MSENQQKNFESQLHTAIESENVDALVGIIKSGADIEAVNARKMTPLHIAALKGNSFIVETLLGAGANPDARDHRGRTAVFLASIKGHTGTLALLLQTPNEGLCDISDEYSRTPLIAAIQSGHSDAARLLVGKGAHVNAQDFRGRTPLIGATQDGRTELVEFLVSSGAQVGDNGRTALLVAAEKGHLQVVEYLLSKVPWVDNSYGRTPLIAATDRGRVKIVEVLLAKGADPHKVDHTFKSAIRHAVEGGQTQILRLFAAKCPLDDGLLVWAVTCGRLETLRYLHEELGMSLGTKNAQGHSLLNLAVRYRSLRVIRYLCGNGCDIEERICSTRTGFVRTVLQLAAAKGATDVVRLLVELGAKIKATGGEVPALHCACANASLETIKALIDLGADVQERHSVYGWTVLHFLTVNDHLREVLTLLVDLGVDVNAVDANGHSALHQALRLNSVEVVEALLDQGADITLPSAMNNVHNIDMVVLRCLFRRGIDLYEVDSNGQSAMHIAKTSRCKNLITSLHEEGVPLIPDEPAKPKKRSFCVIS